MWSRLMGFTPGELASMVETGEAQTKVTPRQRREVTDEAERLVALTGSRGEPDSLQVTLME
jgi:hypothetical protein